MPRLMLLDAQPCDYPAVHIFAHQVVDGAGNRVTAAHTLAEAEAIRDRYATRYPGKKFFAE